MQLDKLEGIALRVKWFLPSHPQLAEFRPDSYLWYVIIVKFRDEATQKRAIGFLIGRFPGHSWATGEMAVPEEALAPMAREGIPFTVEGPATHERILSLRDSLAAGV